MRFHMSHGILLGLAMLACEGYGNGDGITALSTAPLRFTATLTGNAERPTPVVTSASGTASFTVTSGTSTAYDTTISGVTKVTYSLTVSGLSGPATLAHVRGPADVDNPADSIVSLTVTSASTSGNIISGSFTSTGNSTVSMDSLVVLLRNGLSYVNIQTAANPTGEIRGQIRQ